MPANYLTSFGGYQSEIANASWGSGKWFISLSLAVNACKGGPPWPPLSGNRSGLAMRGGHGGVRHQDILYTLLSGHPLHFHGKLAPAQDLSHNNCRLVKRKWALLESNPPGITNWELIETISEGAADKAAPSAVSIDSRMP